jgi:hypothetical protein
MEIMAKAGKSISDCSRERLSFGLQIEAGEWREM